MDKDENIKLKRRVKNLQDPHNLMNQNIELSQMSQWTDYGNYINKGAKKKTTTVLDERINISAAAAMRAMKEEKKVNSQMDKEGLISELLHYKRFSLEQYEQIRLLKVEI